MCSRRLAEWVDGVDLVQDELDRQLPRSDLGEHVLDRGHLLRQTLLGRRPVGHVQDEVGAARLLERRREALDELCGRRRMKPTVSVRR